MIFVYTLNKLNNSRICIPDQDKRKSGLDLRVIKDPGTVKKYLAGVCSRPDMHLM